MKKGIIYTLLFVMLALPALVIPQQAEAATTSRVAIISKWEGTVEVKKSGGTKTFKAYKNMSLNQGDTLTTGKDSSAVLRFSNGTSNDDSMTVEANTTLTFSKLTTKNGTTTKVKMLKGKVWVDVKSIKDKSDEFTLETPTAIMGVRGTHFMIGVNPQTGESMIYVLAGVVQAQPSNSNSGSNNNSSPNVNIYPASNSYLPSQDLGSYLAMISPDQLASQLSPEIIQAMISNYNQIKKENEQFLANLTKSALPSEVQSIGLDLNNYSHNVQYLLDVILRTYADQNPTESYEMSKWLDSFRIKLEEEKKLIETRQALEKQKQLQELEKKQQKELEEKKRQQQMQSQDLAKKLEEQRRLLEEQNKAKQLELKNAAQEKYLQQLSEQEKAKFLLNQKILEEQNKKSDSDNSGGSSGPNWQSITNALDIYYSYLTPGDVWDETRLTYSISSNTIHAIIPAGTETNQIWILEENDKYRVTRVYYTIEEFNEDVDFYPEGGMILIQDLMYQQLNVEVETLDGSSSHVYKFMLDRDFGD